MKYNDDVLLELLRKGNTFREIAEKVGEGRTRQTIERYIKRHFIKKIEWIKIK